MSKAVPVHVIKTYWGYRGLAPLILNLSTRSRWVVSFNVSGCFTPRERICSTHWTGGCI